MQNIAGGSAPRSALIREKAFERYHQLISQRVWVVNQLRINLIALAMTFGAIGFVGFHFVKQGYAQCHPARTLVSEAERRYALESLPGLEEVSFTARDGITLRGWFVPPRNGVVVIFVHGLWGNRAALSPEAEVFVRHGCGVLLYDSRAHGASGGTVATWGSKEAFDVQQATHFVETRPGVSHIVLLGFSVGASAVTRAAANDPTVDAVILYATWTSLREETSYKTSRGGWLGTQLVLLGYRLSGTDIDQIVPEADSRSHCTATDLDDLRRSRPGHAPLGHGPLVCAS